MCTNDDNATASPSRSPTSDRPCPPFNLRESIMGIAKFRRRTSPDSVRFPPGYGSDTSLISLTSSGSLSGIALPMGEENDDLCSRDGDSRGSSLVSQGSNDKWISMHIWLRLFLVLVVFIDGSVRMFGIHSYKSSHELQNQNDLKKQIWVDNVSKYDNVNGTKQWRGWPISTEPLLDGQHRHAIPNILLFTHKINLLDRSDVTKSLEAEQKLDGALQGGDLVDGATQLLALTENVQNIVDVFPNDTQVRFLTDDDCILSLQNMMGVESPLVRHFQQEKVGMFKGDLCRGAALWETGGLYLDIDLGVRGNLFDIVKPTTEFVTVRSDPHPKSFFQAFMGVVPRHPILRRYVELFEDYYEERLPESMLPVKKGPPLGTMLLYFAYVDVIKAEEHVTAASRRNQTIQSTGALGSETSNATKTRMKETSEIWSEVWYHPKFQHSTLQGVPPPVWGGATDMCHYVVVTNTSEKLWTVPFYSRIANSRMCPAAKPGDWGIYRHQNSISMTTHWLPWFSMLLICLLFLHCGSPGLILHWLKAIPPTLQKTTCVSV